MRKSPVTAQIAALALAAVAGCATGGARGPAATAPALTPALTAALDFAAERFQRLVDRIDPDPLTVNAFPSATADGVYTLVPSNEWDAGFFPLSLWLLYELTGSGAWKQAAGVRTLGLWATSVDPGDHDLGYKMWAFGEAWRLTGDGVYLDYLTTSADTLMASFNAGGVDCVGAFKSDLRGLAGGRTKRRYPDLVYPVLISSLTAQGSLFTAAAEAGKDAKPAWRETERVHVLRVIEDFIRPDGSTHDLVDYPAECPFRGFRKRGTYKCNDEAGTWARGHALALHGLGHAYLHTRDARILAAAVKLADFFLRAAAVTDDGVPYWDLRFAAGAREPRDTSAGAIAAVGLLQLAEIDAVEAAVRARYRAGAARLLEALATRYLARDQREGVLAQATPDGPSGTTGVAMIGGDYFFLDGIRRLTPLTGIRCTAAACEIEAESARPLPPAMTREYRTGGWIRRTGPGEVRLTYPFSLTRPGRFVVHVDVEAEAATLQVAIDAAPSTTDAFPLARTRGFERRTVSVRRGLPRIFTLAAGTHRLELSTTLGSIALDRLTLERQP